MAILDQVEKVFLEWSHIKQSDVVPSARFLEDLELDEFEVYYTLNDLEAEFGSPDHPFVIPDDDAKQWATVGDLITYLKDRGVGDE